LHTLVTGGAVSLVRISVDALVEANRSVEALDDLLSGDRNNVNAAAS
jgi:hypothetical protein